MRHFACILLGLASFLIAPSGQAAVPAIPVGIGTQTDWSFARQGGSTRYRAGPVDIVMEGMRDAQSSDLVQPQLTVEYPGYPPVTLIGADTSPSSEHRFAVGRWDAGRMFVLFQSYSGGAHCCTQVQLVLPDKDLLQVIDFGEWDGGYSDRAAERPRRRRRDRLRLLRQCLPLRLRQLCRERRAAPDHEHGRRRARSTSRTGRASATCSRMRGASIARYCLRPARHVAERRLRGLCRDGGAGGPFRPGLGRDAARLRPAQQLGPADRLRRRLWSTRPARTKSVQRFATIPTRCAISSSQEGYIPR